MNETLNVYDAGRLQLVIQEIRYVEGVGNYSRIHPTMGKPILTSRTLKVMAQQLPHFIRIHKRFLVNPIFIDRDSLPSKKQMSLKLRSGEELTVSRRQLAEILQLIAH